MDRDLIRDLSNISRLQAIARLFPELSHRGVRMESGYPGRNWLAGQLPPKRTALDSKVEELCKGDTFKKSLRPVSELKRIGLECPFYAARVWTLAAWDFANKNTQDLQPERKRRLSDERDAFRRRIVATETLLRDPQPDLLTPIGNPYDENVPPPERAAMREASRQRYVDLAAEVERDRAHVSVLSAELGRIEARQGEKTWPATFFLILGRLWQGLTGEEPPQNGGGPFAKFLNAAVNVLRGLPRSEPQSYAWGVARGLHERFREAGALEGFSIAETGEMSLDAITQIQARGQDIANIAATVEQGEPGAYLLIALRDMTDEPEHVLLRELVLRPYFIRNGLMSRVAQAQIGWLYEVTPKQIRSAARRSISAALAGDVRAAAVVDIAQRAQIATRSPSGFAYDIAWPKLLGGHQASKMIGPLFEHAAQRDDPLALAIAAWFCRNTVSRG